MTKLQEEVSLLVRSRFPILLLETSEESRALKLLQDLCKSKDKKGLDRPSYVWSVTKGLVDVNKKVDASIKTPQTLFEYISSSKETAVFILLDFHIYLDQSTTSSTPESYQTVRELRDLALDMRQTEHERTIIMISPVGQVPLSLQKDITVLTMPLPDEMEIRLLLDEMILKQRGSGRLEVYLNQQEKELLCKSALGLTLQEAQNTFAQAMISDGKLDKNDIQFVLQQKQQILKKTGALEYINSDLDMSDVGGLENLKMWFERRNKSWLDAASKYNLPAPKGVLLTGVPGCGKSLCAKAVASMWQLPLLRFDMGTVFGMYVGESEANMRKALRASEALSPCILWMDEIEKGLGDSGGSGDGGAGRRVFGYFLTWMQEKKSPVFVFATANRIESLPPELLRKGRFDEIFFVDLPSHQERTKIFELHLKKRIKSPEILGNLIITNELLNDLSTKTEGFIGAEIEQAIITALYEAYFENRAICVEDIYTAISQTVPLSVTQYEQIAALREWAKSRAVKASNE